MEDPSYKFNFKDLSRFLKDFQYLMQRGGGVLFNNKTGVDKKSIPRMIIGWVVLVFQFILIIIVLYTLYIIIFKGYPRIIIDLLTFNFSNKEKLDELIKENNILVNQFKFLSSNYDSCLTPYSIYQFLYGPTNLYTISKKFESQKDLYYSKYKYDDKYFNAVKEYYLFYNKINTVNSQDVWGDKKNIPIGYKILNINKLNLIVPPQTLINTDFINFIKNNPETIHFNIIITPDKTRQFIMPALGAKSDYRLLVLPNNNYNIIIPNDHINANNMTDNDFIKYINDYNQNIQNNSMVIPIKNTKKCNIIEPNNIKYPQLANNISNKFTIKNYDFYELLLTYRLEQNQINIEKVEGGKKSADQLLYELYENEEKNNFNTRHNMLDIHQTFLEMSKEIKEMNTHFINLPIISYLIIPENDKNINNILKDFLKYKIDIEKNNIYNIPYLQLNDHSWYIIEYILSIKNNNQYNKFIENIPLYTNKDMNQIIYYINLPREQKKLAEQRIMNYSKNINFFEYIKHRPIFAHIYLSRTILDKDKKILYSKIMDTYKLLADCDILNIKHDIEQSTMKLRLHNLQNNGFLIKQLVNTVGYLNLFLNIYRHDLTVMYENQVISNTRFIKELWTPFYNDLVVNRIGNYFKKTFSSEGMGGSYKRFHIYYKKLGVELNIMIKATFKAFFTSVPIEKPEETKTDDGVKNDPNAD